MHKLIEPSNHNALIFPLSTSINGPHIAVIIPALILTPDVIKNSVASNHSIKQTAVAAEREGDHDGSGFMSVLQCSVTT